MADEVPLADAAEIPLQRMTSARRVPARDAVAAHVFPLPVSLPDVVSALAGQVAEIRTSRVRPRRLDTRLHTVGPLQ